MTPQEEQELRDLLLEVLRSDEGRAIIEEIRARRQHPQEAE